MKDEIKLSDLFSEFPDLKHREFIIKANGASMIPTIVKGDRLHVDGKCSHFTQGDIIFGREKLGSLIVHRVISTGLPISTKGDNVSLQTEEIVEPLGKVIKIEKTLISRFRRIWLYGKNLFTK